MSELARQALRDFLADALAKHGDRQPLRDEESIFLSGRLDSFSMMNLVMFLEERFGIRFADDEFDVSLLDSVNDLVAFVERKQGA